MNCPICHKEEANHHSIYGILPGDECKKRRINNTLPDSPIEMVGEQIKTERKIFAKSTLQPFRRGQLSKEYIDAYGPKGIQVTPEEVKKAKKVYTDVYSENFDLKKTK